MSKKKILIKGEMNIMKATVLKKTAGFLALMMLVSMLLPVLAFAAINIVKDGAGKVVYERNGSVTGQVYSDHDLGQGNVAFNVYGYKSGVTGSVYLNVVNATYKSFDGKYYYYELNNASVADTTYDPIKFEYNGEVTDAVYKEPKKRSGGGGGGGYFPGSGNQAGKIVVIGTEVSENDLKNALASYTDVIIEINGEYVYLPASALVGAKAGSTITVVNQYGSYTLPLSVLDLEALAKQLGVEVKDLKIKVEIKKVTGDTADAVKSAAEAIGGKQLADAIDFNVVAEANGKTAAVNFGKTYVNRTINVTQAVYSNKSTGVLYNPDTKKLSFVPSTFAEKDGKVIATLKRNGNSIYTVVEFNKSFNDLGSVQWAKEDIETLANKLIVAGETDTTFAPNRNITRAEFAALVVRSLGLDTVTSATYFSDVDSGAWYAKEVAAAASAGIVAGYEDGTFRPNKNITREELAALVVRALNYAGKKVEVSAAEQAQLLSQFKDSNKIVWGHEELAIAIKAGIVHGMSSDTLASDKQATRAQSAAMLKRFLSEAGFIN